MFAMSHARVGGLAPATASARRGVVGARAALVPAGRASGAVLPARAASRRGALAPRASAASVGAGAADAAPSQEYYSGMEGKALNADQKQFPSMAEVLSKIPKHCFVKDTARSMMYAAVSTALTLGCGVLAYLYLPLQLAYLPAWIAYAFVAGTCATGCWVVAHVPATKA